jgi:hypothetical protein
MELDLKPSTHKQQLVAGKSNTQNFLNVTAKLLALLLRIQEVMGSNLSPQTNYPD